MPLNCIIGKWRENLHLWGTQGRRIRDDFCRCLSVRPGQFGFHSSSRPTTSDIPPFLSPAFEWHPHRPRWCIYVSSDGKRSSHTFFYSICLGYHLKRGDLGDTDGRRKRSNGKKRRHSSTKRHRDDGFCFRRRRCRIGYGIRRRMGAGSVELYMAASGDRRSRWVRPRLSLRLADVFCRCW